MTYKIFKDCHYCLPPCPWFSYNKTVFNKTVCFDNSAAYTPDAEGDINKLYGVVLKGIHHSSARFGWRYTDDGMIEMFAYCYVNGERIVRSLCKAELNTEIKTTLIVTLYDYLFMVDCLGDENVCVAHIPKERDLLPKLMFACRPYFGGNATAPHTITITLNKP